MKVYIAHSGHQIDLGPFDSNRVQTSTQQQQVTNSFLNQSSLLSLKQWIAQQSNISVQNQILLRPNGIKLEDEQSIGEIENETLFVFDRSSFGQSLTVHQQQTYGAVPPKRPTTQELNISEIQYPSLFNSINPDPVLLATARKMYILLKQAEHISLSANNQFELLNRLVQEQKAQAKAVASAYANLNNHSSNVLNSFRQFQQKFSKHEVRFNMLLTSFEDDLNQLGNVELHPKLRSATRQTLLDCVPEKQLRQWAPKCSKELEMFKERIQQGIEIAKSIEKSVETENISSPIVNFKQLSEYVREAAITVQNENQIVDIIMNEYNKLADMITKKKSLASQAASQLIAIHEQNIQKIIQHDQNLQLMVDSCIESKINLTNEMSDRLKGISIIQYNIKMLSRKISTFISITRNILAKFAHLELVHYFPGAYSLALVEILRRRKFLRKYSSEIAKVSNRLTIMREEEQVNRQQFEKYFARFLPPGLIPGLQEKLPANNSLSFMQTTSLLDTSLPSIETPQEIQNVNMSAIRELCGSTLGHGVLKMYATTLDENEMFHQIEYATDPLDDSSFLSFHGVNTRGMLHSRSSSSSSVHAPSYASDNESPSPSPTHSPRSIPSIEQSQKIAHLTKLLSEKETQIEQYEKEREVMKDQLQSSRTTPPNAETTNDLAADSVEKLRDEFAKVERENYKLKETVALKEKLRQEMVHNYEKAMRETQKLKQNTDQYASVLKQISAALVSKTSDSTTKNILNDIVRQLDQPSNSYYSSGNSTGRNNVSLEELVRIVSQLNN